MQCTDNVQSFYANVSFKKYSKLLNCKFAKIDFLFIMSSRSQIKLTYYRNTVNIIKILSQAKCACTPVFESRLVETKNNVGHEGAWSLGI